MKGYEVASRTTLPGRLPVIIRVDGKAFHTYTRGCKRPFDDRLSDVMVSTATKLCDEIQGAQLAYTQSDEISVLVHGYKKFKSQTWFDNQVQKWRQSPPASLQRRSPRNLGASGAPTTSIVMPALLR